jgi:hypothetical protein
MISMEFEIRVKQLAAHRKSFIELLKIEIAPEKQILFISLFDLIVEHAIDHGKMTGVELLEDSINETLGGN